MSEEGKHIPYQERKGWQTLWIVDPLDGTKEFIKQNGEFTVNIALVSDGIPVLGVVYVPASRLLYFGDEKNGAYKIAINEDRYTSKTDIDRGRQQAVHMPIKTKRTYKTVASRTHVGNDTEALTADLKREHPN